MMAGLVQLVNCFIGEWEFNSQGQTNALFSNHSVNPLSPDSDQHQFSPKNIHMLPREMIMRVIKMITKEKML